MRRLLATPDAAKEVRVFGLVDWVIGSFDAYCDSMMQAAWSARRRHRPRLGLACGAVIVANCLAFLVLASDVRTRSVSVREFAIAIQAILGVAILADPTGVTANEVIFDYGAKTLRGARALKRRLGDYRLDHGQRVPELLPIHRGNIELVDVTYSYPSENVDVLSGVSLALEAGTSTALVGANGSGKTTLVKLLCGLARPKTGSILVDGVPLSALDADAWRASIAVVFQDFLRYATTARDNVRMGASDRIATEEDLDRVAARVGLEDVIARLPQGWDTPLTPQLPGGVDLSGGEWQRLALARAMFIVERGATTLVLDEPTASLDVRAEAEFYDSFLDLTRGLTTLLISHRFSSVRRAQRIFVLDSGMIIEKGSHAELMTLGGRYAHLYSLQANSVERSEAGAYKGRAVGAG